MSDEAINQWCVENKKVLATPKEGIDFCKAFPCPALDGGMPLVFYGQSWTDPNGFCYALDAFLAGDKRVLQRVDVDPGEQWDDDWQFLVLDE